MSHLLSQRNCPGLTLSINIFISTGHMMRHRRRRSRSCLRGPDRRLSDAWKQTKSVKHQQLRATARGQGDGRPPHKHGKLTAGRLKNRSGASCLETADCSARDDGGENVKRMMDGSGGRRTGLCTGAGRSRK